MPAGRSLVRRPSAGRRDNERRGASVPAVSVPPECCLIAAAIVARARGIGRAHGGSLPAEISPLIAQFAPDSVTPTEPESEWAASPPIAHGHWEETMGVMLRTLPAGIAILAGLAAAQAADPNRVGSSRCTTATPRRACRSTRRRPSRPSSRSWASSTTWCMFDQHEAQNSLDTIVPDLATSWSWSEDETELTFKLREGVKWHDGKPFTARDVKCTFDMLTGQVAARSSARIRARPGTRNLDEVTTNGDFEVTFHLKRPQPSLLALLASGYSPIYPCHVSPAQHAHAIRSAPARSSSSSSSRTRSIKLARNPDYWKKGRPYLDGIEFTIIPNRSTADPRLRRRQVRHDLPDRGDDPAAEGRQEPGAAGDLRGGADQRQHQPDRQPRRAAVRQCRICAGRWRWRSTARRSSTS